MNDEIESVIPELRKIVQTILWDRKSHEFVRGDTVYTFERVGEQYFPFAKVYCNGKQITSLGNKELFGFLFCLTTMGYTWKGEHGRKRELTD